MSAVPVSRPVVNTRPRVRVTSRSRANVAQLVIARCVMFAVVALTTSAASSLAGSVMVEKARREGIRAVDRARDARAAEAILRTKVNELTSVASIQEWALSHGFQAPDAGSAASSRGSLVAFNR